jgi:hypothetical protein
MNGNRQTLDGGQTNAGQRSNEGQMDIGQNGRIVGHQDDMTIGRQHGNQMKVRRMLNEN